MGTLRFVERHPVYANISICQDLNKVGNQCLLPRQLGSRYCILHKQKDERAKKRRGHNGKA